MIQIKTAEEIALMRSAGLIVADALAAMRAAVAPGVSTGQLDAIAEKVIRGAGAVPSFLGYRGFPKTVCASVNDEIVHGIPNNRRILEEGDVISLDCGAIYHGYHGDSAISVAVGEVAAEVLELMAVTEASMWAGLSRAVAGGRLTDISHAVEASVRSHAHHYGIVDHYGGHGIGTEMHQDPHVLNFGRPGRGPRLIPGLCLAIEPMVTIGNPGTVELPDGWTVVTKDGSLAAHFEHTVAITADGPLVTTAHDGGQAGLATHNVEIAI
ncbi:MAG: type I methionyl aminopeptidase [Actinomycetota bacterium]|nr:type I methionyl aminopeptidase [Actinomycetota bacterium]